jgi:hypothetical protein
MRPDFVIPGAVNRTVDQGTFPDSITSQAEFASAPLAITDYWYRVHI